MEARQNALKAIVSKEAHPVLEGGRQAVNYDDLLYKINCKNQMAARLKEQVDHFERNKKFQKEIKQIYNGGQNIPG